MHNILYSKFLEMVNSGYQSLFFLTCFFLIMFPYNFQVCIKISKTEYVIPIMFRRSQKKNRNNSRVGFRSHSTTFLSAAAFTSFVVQCEPVHSKSRFQRRKSGQLRGRDDLRTPFDAQRRSSRRCPQRRVSWLE